MIYSKKIFHQTEKAQRGVSEGEKEIKCSFLVYGKLDFCVRVMWAMKEKQQNLNIPRSTYKHSTNQG